MGIVHQQRQIRDRTIDAQANGATVEPVTSRVAALEAALAAVTSRVTELEAALFGVRNAVTSRSAAAERQRRYRERKKQQPGT